MVRNQALAFVPCNPDAYFNARSSASCTMSSASASLRDSQRARLYAEFRCGSTSSAQRERAGRSGNRTSIPRMEVRLPDRPARSRCAELVLPHLNSAYNLARWLSRNDADAEDIVQDALERALKYASGLQGTNAKAWFLTIVRHACYDWIGRNRPAELMREDGTEAIEAAVDPRPTPEETVIAEADAHALGRR